MIWHFTYTVHECINIPQEGPRMITGYIYRLHCDCLVAVGGRLARQLLRIHVGAGYLRANLPPEHANRLLLLPSYIHGRDIYRL